MCIFYYFMLKTGNADVHLLHTSQFMLFVASVSEVRNYLNV
jgi:hypothetical protein